ncbi:MAG: class I SAM-dependent methyltransferase [Desulfobacteraceae bacterium]|nr:class I SAM-dependent methyltransferase [Desulfobacteraceae bacterium]
MASSWIAYNELAWTEDLLADPSDYESEAGGYVDLIKGNALHAPGTLLHLGCGAGGYDAVFKRHFAVTGVDISRGMLDKPVGVLLVAGKTREIFSDNNFAYTGEQGDLHVTLLENNHINRHCPDTYEAVLVYLIRRRGKLTLHTERHVLGLFPQEAWEKVFTDAGLTMQEADLDGAYDKYLLGGGAYPLKIFTGRKG